MSSILQYSVIRIYYHSERNSSWACSGHFFVWLPPWETLGVMRPFLQTLMMTFNINVFLSLYWPGWSKHIQDMYSKPWKRPVNALDKLAYTSESPYLWIWRLCPFYRMFTFENVEHFDEGLYTNWACMTITACVGKCKNMQTHGISKLILAWCSYWIDQCMGNIAVWASAWTRRIFALSTKWGKCTFSY